MKQEECCMRPNKTSRAAIRICKADILESAPAFDRKEATAMNEPAAKQRHGCLTAYLMFILVANQRGCRSHLPVSTRERKTEYSAYAGLGATRPNYGKHDQPHLCRRSIPMETMGSLGICRLGCDCVFP